jgi:hypothetical protein
MPTPREHTHLLQGGLLGLATMFLLMIVGLAGVGKIPVYIALPITSTAEAIDYNYVMKLAETDEKYAQCLTDYDACDITTFNEGIMLLLTFFADSALWFGIGAATVFFVHKRKQGKS